MKLSPTEAKPYITVSMDTLYKAMGKGKLKYEMVENGRRIEFAELQKWHEDNYGKLKDPKNGASDSVRSDNGSDSSRTSGESSAESSGADAEAAVLKSRLEMVEEERRRERDQLEEQIGRLEDALKGAREQEVRLTALLTDQRSAEEKEESRKQGRQIEALLKRQARLEAELRESRKGFFLVRWLGIGGSTKRSAGKPAGKSA